MAARGFLSHTKFRGQADAPPPAVSFLYYNTKVNFLVKLHTAINNPLQKLQGVIAFLLPAVF